MIPSDPKLVALMHKAYEALQEFQTAKLVWWAAYCPMEPGNQFKREAEDAKAAAEKALKAMDRYAHRKVKATA